MACGVKSVWLNARVPVVCTFISEKLSFAFCRRTLYRSQLSEARWATPEATCNNGVKVLRFAALRSMLVAATGDIAFAWVPPRLPLLAGVLISLICIILRPHACFGSFINLIR